MLQSPESPSGTASVFTAQSHATLYLDPNILTPNEANEKARPTETTEARKRRVEKMRVSIEAIGQKNPVLVTQIVDAEDGGITYEYVDGGSRVEAIAAINEARGDEAKVWCVLAEEGTDLFQQAVRLNIDRVQNTITDMGMIVQEVIERKGWSGRGGNKKTAEYLGLSESRTSEYLKVLRAPQDVKARIEAGEIVSLDAALALMAIPANERAEIASRAAVLAQEEANGKQAEIAPRRKSVIKKQVEVEAKDEAEVEAPAKASKAKTTKTHIEKAKEEAKGGLGSKWTMGGVKEFFEAVTAAAYGKKATALAEGVLARIDGKIATKRLKELFDAAVGSEPKPSPKPAKATKAAATKKVAVKKAPAVKKAAVKKQPKPSAPTAKKATKPAKKAAKPAKKSSKGGK